MTDKTRTRHHTHHDGTLHDGADRAPAGAGAAALRSLWAVMLGAFVVVLLAGVAVGALIASTSPSGAMLADGMSASGGDRLAMMALVTAGFTAMATVTAALWRYAAKHLLDQNWN